MLKKIVILFFILSTFSCAKKVNTDYSNLSFKEIKKLAVAQKSGFTCGVVQNR